MTRQEPRGHLIGTTVSLYEFGDQGAVYVDGILTDGPGDIGNRYEYLLHGFDVEYATDPAAFQDIDGNSTPAKTIGEIQERVNTRNLAIATSDRLRAQAKDLLRQAEEIDPRPF